MKSLKILLFSIIAIVFNTANASPLDPHHFPKELAYLGKPIDPGCFAIMGRQTDDNKYKLSECTRKIEEYKITFNDYLIKRGFYGDDWESKSSDSDGLVDHGYDYYKAWPAGDNRYWIVPFHNGGGTGIFTSIALLTRVDGDTIMIQGIDGGDRSNGGIVTENVQLVGDGIQYSTYVTPADLLSLENANPHHLEAYDDLAACARCRSAEAVYFVNLKLEPKFLYLDLDKNTDPDEMPQQGKYQRCFNKIQASYVSRGMNKLNDNLLSRFMEDFNRLCVI